VQPRRLADCALRTGHARTPDIDPDEGEQGVSHRRKSLRVHRSDIWGRLTTGNSRDQSGQMRCRPRAGDAASSDCGRVGVDPDAVADALRRH